VHREAPEYNVRRLVRLAQLGERERLRGDGEIWKCALCLQCNYICPLKLEINELILKLREAAGRNLPAPAAYFVGNTIKYGLPLPVDRDRLASWAEPLGLKRGGEQIFLAGLYPLLDYVEPLLRMALSVPPQRFASLSRMLCRVQRLGLDRRPLLAMLEGKDGGLLVRASKAYLRRMGMEMAKAGVGTHYRNIAAGAAELLLKLGVALGYLYQDEPWCGLELHTYGMRPQFAAHASRVYAMLKGAGVRRIITPDTLSYVALKQFYPEVVPDFDIEVKHWIEVFLERVRVRRLRFKPQRAVVAFSDPCYLARYSEMVEPPREALKKAGRVELREVADCGLNTRCDGGGGMEVAYPHLALRLARSRLEELKEVKAQAVVTACPVCVLMLRLAAMESGEETSIYDIAEFIRERLA